MHQCTEIVINGRCPQDAWGDNEYCYYHEKVHAGLMTTADVIGALEED